MLDISYKTIFNLFKKINFIIKNKANFFKYPFD